MNRLIGRRVRLVACLMVVMAVGLAFTLSGCSSSSSAVDTIKDRGYITVGCKTDAPYMCHYDKSTDTWSGEEVNLAYEVAGKIWDVSAKKAQSEDLVKFVDCDADNREDNLENNKVDLLIATYTITDKRAKKFALSDAYYTDYIGLMVRSDDEAAINNTASKDTNSNDNHILSLGGKSVGVATNTTTEPDIDSYLEKSDKDSKSPNYTQYKTYKAIFEGLKGGEVEYMAADVSILKGYETDGYTILNDRIEGQDYGAAATKENADLIKVVNKAIAATKESH